MALNPVLAEDGSGKLFPLPAAGEIFFLRRDNIGFRLRGPGANLKGSGCFFLSSSRIVFLRAGKVESHGSSFSSCELPLHLMQQAQFKQPIFGANYLEGQVHPKQEAENPIQGTSTFTLTFNAGGCGTFINVFFRLWKNALSHQQPDNSLLQQLHLGAGAAFVDPSDPSVVYVTQPQPANQPGQQQQMPPYWQQQQQQPPYSPQQQQQPPYLPPQQQPPHAPLQQQQPPFAPQQQLQPPAWGQPTPQQYPQPYGAPQQQQPAPQGQPPMSPYYQQPQPWQQPPLFPQGQQAWQQQPYWQQPQQQQPQPQPYWQQPQQQQPPQPHQQPYWQQPQQQQQPPPHQQPQQQPQAQQQQPQAQQLRPQVPTFPEEPARTNAQAPSLI
ncbi:hypothetical protein, conserved [Eimeria tenella]|uniref:Arabinogalactan protein n=1 Tax=Eimeria tenella TaxID=5802 RepID=U6KVX5_EIMTE|nr:hypothetical protein, conserved [Eimeria tenella]CDJ42121.1 hypothetical protein, conserved [Eimeria tenella]|eukprot:XP_013232871.1 hypothetical protein, conserved [Eimeria tenella]